MQTCHLKEKARKNNTVPPDFFIMLKLVPLFLKEIRDLDGLLFYIAGRSPRLQCRHCASLCPGRCPALAVETAPYRGIP